MAERIVFLDTETTGLSPQQGDRVIELGCIEMIDRVPTGRTFHHYMNPQGKAINVDAQAVHGISATFLADKPHFGEILQGFVEFVHGAHVVIHNAPFDVGFLNAEFERFGCKPFKVHTTCTITDTLVLAKNQFPGKRNSLDGLCDRFGVNRSNRQLHGALLDARLLGEVYLYLTRSQETLGMALQQTTLPKLAVHAVTEQLQLFSPTEQALQSHEQYLDNLSKENKGQLPVWRAV